MGLTWPNPSGRSGSGVAPIRQLGGVGTGTGLAGATGGGGACTADGGVAGVITGGVGEVDGDGGAACGVSHAATTAMASVVIRTVRTRTRPAWHGSARRCYQGPVSEIHRASGSELSAKDLHDILELRVRVFVVEQTCPYQEIDGRDLDASTRHLWLRAGASKPLAYLRILRPVDAPVRIGRVVTAPEERGRGLSATLMAEALAEIGDQEAVLDAQVVAQGLYAKFGFLAEGEPFDEDGIPHITMRRHPVAHTV
ncbi:putative GNAT family N-acyltransferase [Herbihabitans rhizosphaerae]|uniref:Putative GNAT family N-acyltransferase n=1 Tax=Herbihabitans rhizosphaerae TaxID=1872711 RepID=A0A4Q7KF38_9PSEU|nr:putative GNAT family N-acyltransferase [Herbihabitans rhizosphaerae]